MMLIFFGNLRHRVQRLLSIVVDSALTAGNQNLLRSTRVGLLTHCKLHHHSLLLLVGLFDCSSHEGVADEAAVVID
jgi:hypothetical protein